MQTGGSNSQVNRTLQHRFSRMCLTLVLAPALLLISLGAQGTTPRSAPSQAITISYAGLVDRSEITHSGQTVGQVLEGLRASGLAKSAESAEWFSAKKRALELRYRRNELSEADYRKEKEALQLTESLLSSLVVPEDALKSLVEPFLEPYAFLLEDALESLPTTSRKKGLIDVGDLFPEGEAQPAWADLVRSRRFYALSDGAGFVRMFLPGGSAQQAYDRNLTVIRHIIGFLLRSASNPSGLDLEVYAYEHDLKTQTLRLQLASKKLRLQSAPPLPNTILPLGVGDIASFLKEGAVITGASIDASGQLVLLGKRAAASPTIAGQPLSLADLAVAYRAVFYSGHNAAYVSLDPSGYTEQAAANFGGRLKDTGLGWVVLLSDMRFKTIANAFDPTTGDDLRTLLRGRLPDFLTQSERLLRVPIDKRVSEEQTRFWFYPDSIAIAASSDGHTITVASPRFTADAERESASGNEGERLSQRTPPWTKDAIDHLNRHYETYAQVFPELAELDHTGRLLAVFTWLKQRKDLGLVSVDLDMLLDVQLPKCRTPRRVPQALFTYLAGKHPPYRILAYDVSPLADQLAQRAVRFSSSKEDARQLLTTVDQILGSKAFSEEFAADELNAFRKPFVLAAQSTKAGTPSVATAQKQSSDLGLTALMLRMAQATFSRAKLDPRTGLRKDDIVSDQYDFYSVVTGGIELDLSKKLVAHKLPDADAATYAALLRQTDGTSVNIGGTPWQRSPRGIGTPPAPTAGKPHRLIADGTMGKRGDPEAVSIGGGGGRRYSGSGGPPGGFGWDRTSPDDPSGRGSSRTAYFDAMGAAVLFARFDGERPLKYRLAGNGSRYLATLDDARTRSIHEDLKLIAQADLAKNTDWHWQNLPEDTSIVAVERTPDARTAVLYRSQGQDALVYLDRPTPEATLRARDARTRFDEIAQAQVRAASSDALQFVHASLDGTDVVLQRGNVQRRVPREALRRLMENPRSSERSVVDEVLGIEGDIVVYRDAEARRPLRYGGSSRTGTEADPIALATMINERYGKARAFLADETTLAISNRSSTKPIARKAEVVGLIPDDTFNIDHRGYGDRLRNALTRGGIRVTGSIADVGSTTNVLMVSGHNDVGLRTYLVGLGKSGALKDRVLLLTTCAAPDNPQLFHELITLYGAKAVLLHDQPIRPHALERVMPHIGPLLEEAEQSGITVEPAELMKRAAQRALDEPGLSERLRFEIQKLIRGTLQLSKSTTIQPSPYRES